MTGRARVERIRWADPDHRVVSTVGGPPTYRRQPCGADTSTPERPGCPWRADACGHFPPEAFELSANTAHDVAARTFGCHESTDPRRAAICAGFLLRGSVDNLAARMHIRTGLVDLDQVHDGGHALHPGYFSMAVANGVDPASPALDKVRLSPWEEESGVVKPAR